MQKILGFLDVSSFIPVIEKSVILGFKALVTLGLGWILAAWISNAIKTVLIKSKLETTIRRSIHKIISVVLKAIVIAMVLNTLGVKMTVLAAVFGGFSIAIGLALKGNISNISDGVALLMTRHFKVGDFVDVGGDCGTVDRINLFTTELTTPNNQRLLIPNSTIFGSTLTNFASNPTRRIELLLGLSYSDDIEKAALVLKESLQSVEGVLADPGVDVYLTDFGDSSINYSIRVWCERTEFLKVRHRIIIKVKAVCDEHGFTIPFPQQDVHLFKEETPS